MEHPHQVRVREEASDLKLKIERLSQFLEGVTYWSLPTIERLRLRVQLRFMEGYAAILDERIGDFQ